MKTVAAVYTGFDNNLYTIIDKALKKNLADIDYKLITKANPILIAKTLEAGYPTKEVASNLLSSMVGAVHEGADVILSVCSTMGDLVCKMQPVFEQIGVPIVRIDEAMMKYAITTYKRVALIATCKTIMVPNKNLMEKCLKEEGKDVSVTYIIIDAMQGKPGEEASQIAVNELRKYSGEIDCVVLTQASMSTHTEEMSNQLKIPVLSSPDFGAKEIATVLKIQEKEHMN